MTDLYAHNVCRGGVPNAALRGLIARGFAGMHSISYEHDGGERKSSDAKRLCKGSEK